MNEIEPEVAHELGGGSGVERSRGSRGLISEPPLNDGGRFARSQSRAGIVDRVLPRPTQNPDSTPPTWDDILRAVGVAGAPFSVEEILLCWRTAGHDDPAKRCVLAHYIADVQSAPKDALVWDMRALRYWKDTDFAAFMHIGIQDRQALLPSLHLNLADSYWRLADFARAGRHAIAALSVLDDVVDSLREDHPMLDPTRRAAQRLLINLGGR